MVETRPPPPPPAAPVKNTKNCLQSLKIAVQATILQATSSNHCANFKDRVCKDLVQSILDCLLLGYKRFRCPDDDRILLTVVPEFAPWLKCDVHLIAYLCVNHQLVPFFESLHEQHDRISHFYFPKSFMRDEELHLALVSNAYALEKVTFHTPQALSKQFLTFSLKNVTLQKYEMFAGPDDPIVKSGELDPFNCRWSWGL